MGSVLFIGTFLLLRICMVSLDTGKLIRRTQDTRKRFSVSEFQGLVAARTPKVSMIPFSRTSLNLNAP